MPRWATSPPIGLLWPFAVAAILGFATDPLTHLAHHWGSGRVASEVDVHREHRARGAEPDTHRHNHNHTHQQPVPQRLPQGAAGDAIVSTLPHYLIVGVPKAGTSVLYFGLCGKYSSKNLPLSGRTIECTAPRPFPTHIIFVSPDRAIQYCLYTHSRGLSLMVSPPTL